MVIARSVLTDERWAFVTPLMPRRDAKERPRINDRDAFAAVLYNLMTGVGRAQFPSHLVGYSTVVRRIQDWTVAGLWHALNDAAVGESPVERWAREVARAGFRRAGIRQIPPPPSADNTQLSPPNCQPTVLDYALARKAMNQLGSGY